MDSNERGQLECVEQEVVVDKSSSPDELNILFRRLRGFGLPFSSPDESKSNWQATLGRPSGRPPAPVSIHQSTLSSDAARPRLPTAPRVSCGYDTIRR